MNDDVKAAAERLLGAAREVITDEQNGDEYADGVGYPGLQADLVTVAQFALEAADRQAALTAELGRVKGVLSELFDYTKRLEGASAAWFITRSYAKRPDVAEDLGDRIRAALNTAPAVALGTTPAEAGERL